MNKKIHLVPNKPIFFIKLHRYHGYKLLQGQGLEIGALHRPAVLPKSCTVEYCDVHPKKELLEHFPELAKDKLVDVNYICDLNEQGLSLFKEGQFDFVIFNHVIEHIANPIYIVEELFRVTKLGGCVVISAPDKRFTFDRHRTLTSFEHLLNEYNSQVTEVTDEHYLDFLKHVHPNLFAHNSSPQLIEERLRITRERREHAHVWDSAAFKDFLLKSFDLLNVKAHCLLESTGEDNRCEYFSVWKKEQNRLSQMHQEEMSASELTPQQGYQLAEQHFKANDLAQAETICRKILAVIPKHADTLHLLGLIGVQTGHLKEAEKLIRKALSIEPDNINFQKNLAKIWQLQGNFKTYAEWFKQYNKLTPNTVQLLQQKLGAWQHALPLISVVMPTYNSDEKWLRIAIESVVQQIYPYWELCIADDASTTSNVREILEEYAQKDKRIKVYFCATNRHISMASNSALALVEGDYVALFDHDDILPPHALFLIAGEIVKHPHAALIYVDEDKVDIDGKYSSPYFKPDWNPDLLLSHNYLAHSVYKTALIREIGGFRAGYEGAQDYDLVLRAIERIQTTQIRHIPHILYHWRVHEGSASSGLNAKPYAIVAAQKAVRNHIERQGKKARVTETFNVRGCIRVQYILPDNPPLVSLIIPTYNQVDLLRGCIGSILAKTNYKNFEIIVVDNRSDDPKTLAYLSELQYKSHIRVIQYPDVFNYSAINNVAVEEAHGEIIGLLNNDMEVINESWLTEMVSHAIRPEIGAVGARLWYEDNTLQHAGVILGIISSAGHCAGHSHKGLPRRAYGYAGRAQLIQNFSAVTGACMVLRKEIFKAAGGLNSTDLKIAFNDIDLCLKIRELGLYILWTPYAELYHYESKSRGYEDTPEKKERFQKEVVYLQSRWEKILVNDPAYNPNLTLNGESFNLAWPPRVLLDEAVDELIQTIEAQSTLFADSSYLRQGYALLNGHGLEIGIPRQISLLPYHCMVDFYDETQLKYEKNMVSNTLDREGLSQFQNGQFSFVILNNILENVDNLIWVLQEAIRLVKLEGYVVFYMLISNEKSSFASFEDLLTVYRKEKRHIKPEKHKKVQYWTPEVCKELLSDVFNFLRVQIRCEFEYTNKKENLEYFSIWRLNARQKVN